MKKYKKKVINNMKDLQKKIERLEKDNKEMLYTLKTDFADFRLIKNYIKAFKTVPEYSADELIKNILDTCRSATVDLKRYTRRK
jgi:predicted lipase